MAAMHNNMANDGHCTIFQCLHVWKISRLIKYSNKTLNYFEQKGKFVCMYDDNDVKIIQNTAL